MKKLIMYYEDKDLNIQLSDLPEVMFQVPYSWDPPEVRKDKIKKPFLCENGLMVVITDTRHVKDKPYSFYIPENYTWDGASIPRMFWRFIGPKTDPKFVIASLLHDNLCEHHDYIDNDRYLSTLVLEKCCKVAGVGPYRRWCIKHSTDNFQKMVGKWK